MASTERLRAHLGRVYGQTTSTMLMALLGAWGQGLDRGHIDSDYAARQLDFQSAGGRWLAQWGEHFAVTRRAASETDDEYASRIIAETVRQRPQIHALEAILLDAFGIVIDLEDLYPYVLQSDQWMTPDGYPPQLCDAHLLAGFGGAAPDKAARCDAYPPYAPGMFGAWMTVDGDDPYAYTLEQLTDSFPLFLIADEQLTGVEPYLHVSDGHLTSPELSGGPTDTARKSFGPLSVNLPVTEADVLNIMSRHRAAGTHGVMMQVTII